MGLKFNGKCPHVEDRERGGEDDMKKSDDDDMSDNATTQDTAKGVWSQQKLKEGGRILPWSLWKEHGPADTLISDFWPPELGENKLLSSLSHQICYNLF